MELPVRPPVEPMLAKLMPALPEGPEWRFEPKWDGFRCIVFHDGAAVDIRSRNDRPLSRYFPEVVEAVEALAPGLVLDGEIVVRGDRPFDFAALMKRLHPASSRVDLLREETPAELIVFDAVAVGGIDLRAAGFDDRRTALVTATEGSAVTLTPSTADRPQAERWLADPGPGVDGVVAKAGDLRYQPGKRVMVKVKRQRTADCVVGGFRLLAADEPLVSSLVLGLYDDGVLRHVGVVGSFTKARRRELLADLAPLAAPLTGHPWEHGFGVERSPLGRLRGSAGRWTPDMGLDWVPIRPTQVCEVAYDQVDGRRFRHPARFVRWRPDRDPASCVISQLEG